MSKDKIGDRMKSQYEDRTRHFLPRRTYTVIRLDGKAFHTFTKGFDRPYDLELSAMMNFVMQTLFKEVQGCKLGYVQSDEISLILTDFEKVGTCAYFNGNTQKIASITASIATAAANSYLHGIYEQHQEVGEEEKVAKFLKKDGTFKTALFDSRAFTIPDRVEVGNYLVWRQQDATRNSISMLAQSEFSHKQLHKKNTSQMQDMLMLEKGINWNDCDPGFKRGRVCYKEDGTTIVEAAPIFTSDEFQFIRENIPKIRDYETEV